MSDVRDLVFGPCQTCLRPICQCPAKPTPPSDAQAMTKQFKAQPLDPVESGRSGIIFQGTCVGIHPRDIAEIIVSQLNTYDQAQRETIRDIRNTLKQRDAFVKQQRDRIDQLHARLTASEAKHKWKTARPTVAGLYFWRLVKGRERIVEVSMLNGILYVPVEGGEWQGPLTPGEE